VRVPVVNPNGTVKRIRISNTITSPILLPQFAENDKTGELVLVGATIRAGYKEDGWELLEDMYRSEGEEYDRC
jgi:AMMECR1 domain-containing protein